MTRRFRYESACWRRPGSRFPHRPMEARSRWSISSPADWPRRATKLPCRYATGDGTASVPIAHNLAISACL